MSIKYADITIIRNLQENNIFKGLIGFGFIGYENIINDKDIIIITFEDGSICNIKDEYIDKKYNFSISKCGHYPTYFETDQKKTLVYKKTYLKNKFKNLKLSEIFKDNTSYRNKVLSSIYNVIYKDINENEKLAIFKFKSSKKDNLRFKLAYHDDYFDKSDIIYLINHFLFFLNKNL
jgi:hypothetical protein